MKPRCYLEIYGNGIKYPYSSLDKVIFKGLNKITFGVNGKTFIKITEKSLKKNRSDKAVIDSLNVKTLFVALEQQSYLHLPTLLSVIGYVSMVKVM